MSKNNKELTIEGLKDEIVKYEKKNKSLDENLKVLKTKKKKLKSNLMEFENNELFLDTS